MNTKTIKRIFMITAIVFMITTVLFMIRQCSHIHEEEERHLIGKMPLEKNKPFNIMDYAKPPRPADK